MTTHPSRSQIRFRMPALRAAFRLSIARAAISGRRTRVIGASAGLIATVTLTGCSHNAAMARIDRAVEALVAEGGQETRISARPSLEAWNRPGAASDSVYDEQPDTVNPPAIMIPFEAAIDLETQSVIDRLESFDLTDADTISLDLASSLKIATERAREFRFAEEEYILAALRLLQERHRWGPRFFDEVRATLDADADDGDYDTALSLVNELSVTQRLPYGGTVSARLLARATEDLHSRVADVDTQSADFILAADIPLLRGSGMVARESRIQAERSLIYAARAFERFRREFLFSIVQDYLDLVVLRQRITIATAQAASFESLEEQQRALMDAGRSTPFDAAEAENDKLEAVDSLNAARERFRLSADRFKVRIGLDPTQVITVVPDSVNIPTPHVDMTEAVAKAMRYRLDLQTRRDRVADARRSLEVARDDLRGDLDFSASATIPTDPDRDRSGLRFDGEEIDAQVGVTFGLPLDREIERLSVRQSQIDLARSERDFARFRDEVAIGVRQAVRGIDAALFSLQIQEQNVVIAEQRVASIAADPDRANIRQKSDAIDALARAESGRDDSRRDLEVAVISYLLATGQLRVQDDGMIESLFGMELTPGAGG